MIISSNAEEKGKDLVTKCPYLAKVHNSDSVDNKKSECPYLSNKSKSECPYSGKEKMSDSKKGDSKCPYTGKSKQNEKVKREINYYHSIQLDKS
jgi:hypothetical protein